MNIGVDIHVIGGIFQGSARYLESLYRAVGTIPTPHVFYFAAVGAAQLPREWSDRGRVVELGTHSSLRRLAYNAPVLARRHGLDLFHFQYVTPLWSACPSAVTIHDVLPVTHPQYFTRSFVLTRRFLFRRSVRTARLIFTVSEFSKRAIQEQYNVADDRLVVTRNGVDLAHFHADGRETSAAKVLEKYGVSEYILTVGRLEPRKNHAALVRAYKQLLSQGRDLPPLVIVGQRDFHFHHIFQLIDELGLRKHVHILEDVGHDWLPHVYRAAQVFVYPSWAEGFGIPPLEALACGCPVICSNTTALPEVVGDAGVLVPPDDVEQISGAIDRLLGDGALRTELRSRGTARAKEFTWDASAHELLKGFDRCA